MLAVATKIDAVNLILSSVGDSPVDTLEEHDNVDVDNAVRLLDSISRSVQARGWDFNSYESYRLKPDMYTKHIRYNPHFIHFRAVDGRTIVKRGGLLYDMTNQSDKFENDIDLNVIMAVDFEDMPQCFKDYTTAQAAVKFQQRYMGDDGVSQDLMLSAQQSYQDIVAYDMSMGSYNMLQFTGVAEALSRT